MSEQSAKPYLVRAICEWCADNGLTPYLAVKVNARDARARGVRQERRDRAQHQRVGDAPAHDRQRLACSSPRASPARRRRSRCRCRAVAGIFAKETGLRLRVHGRAGSRRRRSPPPRRRRSRTSAPRWSATCGSRAPRRTAASRRRGRRTCRSSSSAAPGRGRIRRAPFARPSASCVAVRDASAARRSCGVRIELANGAPATIAQCTRPRPSTSRRRRRRDVAHACRSRCRRAQLHSHRANCVAKSARVADCHFGGVGASKITACAGIAQLVEQRFCKPLVVGSIPTAGTRSRAAGAHRISVLGRSGEDSVGTSAVPSWRISAAGIGRARLRARDAVIAEATG